MRKLLDETTKLAASYLELTPTRPVKATQGSAELRHALGAPLGVEGESASQVIQQLAAAGVTGTVAMSGPRYFGFVVGGSLPAALAADWLVSTWDQNSALYAMSPLVSIVEDITASWLREIVGLPASTSVGFVTGCQMANFTSLAAARHRVLSAAGWSVETDGLFGAPPVEVFINEEAHYTIPMALRHLGFGARCLRLVPTDSEGRMRADELATMLRDSRGPAIVCAQAGNVNTGAFDPIDRIAPLAKERGAWLHVDGAFGLWAAASPEFATLVRGIEQADSIATDAHKWLNVPYDCGIVFCADEIAHRSSMSIAGAAYIPSTSRERDPHEFVPEESRRGRAVTVYAALRSLGRNGLADLVEHNCRQARRFADGLRAAGHEVLNHVVLNQVVVSFGDADTTRRTIAAVQDEGTCWCGGTVWKGRTAMRISVSNWATTDADVELSLAAILRVAATVNDANARQ